MALQFVLQQRGAHIPVPPIPLARTRTDDILRPGSFLDSPSDFLFPRSSQATDILTEAGTTCSKCGSSETSKWLNSPDVPEGKVCKKCWDQANSKSRKKKK